jgi:3-oxoadipate enol-lactonase
MFESQNIAASRKIIMPSASINGTTLDYDLTGNGVPLLLIHGAFLARSEWDLQIAALSPTCQLIIPDLRGHGTSGKGGDYSAALFAADLIALLDHLGIARAVVGGHSMGGTVAQVLAADYPNRVIAVILAETNYGTGNEPMMRVAAGMTTALARLLGPKRFLNMGAGALKTPDPAVTARIQASFRSLGDNPANVLSVISAMNAFDGSALLARIRCPTLVLVGANNRLSHKQAQHMAQTIPNAKLVSIPDAGHGVNLDNAAAFNTAVLEFIRALPHT